MLERNASPFAPPKLACVLRPSQAELRRLLGSRRDLAVHCEMSRKAIAHDLNGLNDADPHAQARWDLATHVVYRAAVR